MPLSTVLKEAPTEDLVNALSERFDAQVFIAIKQEDIHLFLNGSSVLCQGLLSHAQSEILWASFGERSNS